MKTSNILLIGFFLLMTTILAGSYWTLKKKVDEDNFTLKATNKLPTPDKSNTFKEYKVIKIKGLNMKYKRDASLYYADYLQKYVLALAARSVQTKIAHDTLTITYQKGDVSTEWQPAIYLSHIDQIVAENIGLYYLPQTQNERNSQIHLELKDAYFRSGFSNPQASSKFSIDSIKAKELGFKMGNLSIDAQSSDIDLSYTYFSKLRLNLDSESSLKILGEFSVDELPEGIPKGIPIEANHKVKEQFQSIAE